MVGFYRGEESSGFGRSSDRCFLGGRLLSYGFFVIRCYGGLGTVGIKLSGIHRRGLTGVDHIGISVVSFLLLDV